MAAAILVGLNVNTMTTTTTLQLQHKCSMLYPYYMKLFVSQT